MIFLDTSFLIRALVAGSRTGARLRSWLAGGEPLAMSAIAWGEFLGGPLPRSAQLDCRNLLDVVVPLGESTSELAADLFNTTGRRHGSFADCLIAATAIDQEARLATMNGQDFERFTDLGLVLTD